MAASDKCEPQILSALQKEGWQVIDRPFTIEWGDSFVYADLRLERGKIGELQQIVVVEVKCFADTRSQITEFYHALGQYQFYRAAMELAEKTEKIYLAVPNAAYNWFQNDPTVQHLLKKNEVKLIVVDLLSEEIVEWII